MTGQVFFNLAALEADIVGRLEHALATRERASLLVSGGSSPAPLFHRLSERDLPWERIDVALVDERWVDSSHPRSNARFVRETLLQNRAAQARFTGMFTGETSPRVALAQVETSYRALPQPFDITVLGMGPDGHFASLFPEAEGLGPALDPDGDRLCAAITAHPSAVTGQETERVSLSLAGILNSRAVYLLITDQTKLARYCEARTSGGDARVLPLRALLQQQRVPVHVYQDIPAERWQVS